MSTSTVSTGAVSTKRGQTPRLAELHVAAMPFPTRQGTQAAVHAMADASAMAGHETHLLTYGRGEDTRAGNYVHHRARTLPGESSAVSGPSLKKLGDDVFLRAHLTRLGAARRFDVTVAHHVEAGAMLMASRLRPWLFCAHTTLEHELPAYFPPPVKHLGKLLDATLARSAAGVCAVSPDLADYFSRKFGVDAHYLPVPWPLPRETEAWERHQARAKLGLPGDATVGLYCGNLDAYQGWETLLQVAHAVHAQDANFMLLIATASDPRPARAALAKAGAGQLVRVRPLDGETSRRDAHAAADVVLVPRKMMGGVSIKLLDALSRGASVVTNRLASAGLDLGDAAVVADDHPEAMTRAVLRVVNEPTERRANAARSFVRKNHSNAHYSECLDAVLRSVR